MNRQSPSSGSPTPQELRFAVLATDVVVFRITDGELVVLLGRVNVPPHFIDAWGVIGGLIRPDETADQSVDRHLRDKAGLTSIYKEQLAAFSGVDRDPRGRVVSLGYLAMVDEDRREQGDVTVKTRWCPVRALPKLAYDHNEIVETAIDRLKARIGTTNIAQHLLPKRFTLSELQQVYEIVLGRKLDKRNFRSKVLQIDLLKDTGEVRRGEANRPASLYSFRDRKTKTVEII